MAHNIEINNGVASFVENGRKERAWHRLGQVFDGAMSVSQALELSHADYQVELRPIVALTPGIAEHIAMDNYSMQYFQDEMLDAIVPGKKVTMRMDTMKPLGVVSDSYGVVQNRDAFKFLDTLVTGQLTDSEHTPVIESAGVLGHGERVFVTAKFPEQIRLDNKGDDRVEMYVVFTTSHDGTGSVNCMVTPIRVVCNNTLNMALGKGGNAGKISLRHTSGINERLDLTNAENAKFAYKTLNMYNVYKQSLEESLNHLRQIKVSEKQLQDIMAEVLLTEGNLKLYKESGINHADISSVGRNQFNAVMQAMEKGIGQEYGERGTGLWAINGLTTYFQNEKNFSSDELKFNNLMNGTASLKVQHAYDLLMAV